ncbi:MAG: iron-sulfur cluster insertion protein ErpA [Sinimarinibacterium sp.]
MNTEEMVIFTQAAADKVYALLQEEDDSEQMLRVFVTGGGCSGFQYGFKFEKQAEDDDERVVRSGVTLLVDPMSLQYLQGAEIDYKESVEGAQFVIRNPNATTSCGCGNSFSV